MFVWIQSLSFGTRFIAPRSASIARSRWPERDWTWTLPRREEELQNKRPIRVNVETTHVNVAWSVSRRHDLETDLQPSRKSIARLE